MRLPEEVDRVDDDVDDRRLLDACRGTPLDGAAASWSTTRTPTPRPYAEVTGLRSAGTWSWCCSSSRSVQVLLLSLSVFAFFLVFGSLVDDRRR